MYPGQIDTDRLKILELRSKSGIRCKLTNLGCRIMELLVPNKNGKLTDVVLGFDTAQEYLEGPETFFGSVVGRVANRIANAAFNLDGKTYELAANHGKHHIHGGERGLHRVVWNVLEKSESQVVFVYHSPAGEEGYPGTLDLKVTYKLSDEKGLEIRYEAQADKRTPLNLTNHSYFNLNGAGNQNIENHIIQIYASSFLPSDKEQIPTGEIRPVDNTPFDLSQQQTIGPLLSVKNEQIEIGNGFDHHFIADGKGMRLQAEAISPLTGIKMEVWSDQPGLQFFCGAAMKKAIAGKKGKVYGKRAAFCMETQGYPNSLNQPGFPRVIVEPGFQYQKQTIFKFKIG